MFGKRASCGAVLALLLSLGAAGAAEARSQPRKALRPCPVTGMAYWQCCASKASPMPPCCMRGCDAAGRIMRP